MIFSEKYEPLFDITTYPHIRYVVLVGGRASGKSTALAHFLHDFSFTGSHVIINTRFTMGSAKDSVIAEFDKAIEARESQNFFEQTNTEKDNTHSNCKILFKGLKSSSKEQTARLKSITDLNVWVLDEAEELHDEEVFDDVDDSIRRVGFQNLVIFVLNSHHINKDHFIYRRFFEDAGVQWGYNGMKENVMYIHSTYLDNLDNLSESYRLKIKATKKKYPDKYRYNFMGDIRTAAEGVIFENWTYGEFDESLPFGYGMDFGFFPDPDVCVKVAIDRKRKIIYVKKSLKMNNAGLDHLANKLKQSVNLSKVIYADSAEPRLISDLKRKGIHGIEKVKKGAGSVLAGIKIMQDFDIVVDNDSQEIATELNNYVWSDRKKGIPIDLWNHFIDAIRYYTQSTIKMNPKKGQRVL